MTQKKTEPPTRTSDDLAIPGTCPFLTGNGRVVARLRHAACKKNVIYVVVKTCVAGALAVTLDITGVLRTFSVRGIVRDEKLLLNHHGKAYWLEKP